jgi:hypothetical protein
MGLQEVWREKLGSEAWKHFVREGMERDWILGKSDQTCHLIPTRISTKQEFALWELDFLGPCLLVAMGGKLNQQLSRYPVARTNHPTTSVQSMEKSASQWLKTI